MSAELWERLVSSETVFEGRLISVRVEEVELPGGGRARREIVVHPGAVAVVPLLPEGRVLMIRQYRHAAGQVLYELPAGTVQAGESPPDCARRELAEETGYAAGKLELVFSTYLSPGYSTELIGIFLARDLHPAQGARQEPDERVVPVVLPFEEAVAMVRRGEVRNAAAICGLLAAARWGGAGGGAIE